MAGLTYRRAAIIAVAFLVLYLLLRNINQEPEAPLPSNPNSPPPIGTYDDIRKVLDWNPPARPTETSTSTKPGQKHEAPRVKKGKRPQVPIENLKLQPFRKQLAMMFPYDSEGKFPAYIWQTWRHSPSEGKFKEEFRPMEASWTVLHPSFIHEVITDDVARNLVRHLFASIPEIFQAYEALPAPVLKADFFRYLILLARGGIYSDIDTLALKSAIDWVPEAVSRSTYGLVVGIEADPDRPDWKEWYSRRIQFCQWTIQSKPGHPVLVDVVATIVEKTFDKKKSGVLSAKAASKDIIEFTGPAVWTDAIFKYFNDPEYFDMSNSQGTISWRNFTGMEQSKKVGDVIVLPITSFSPGVEQMGSKGDDDPMAFVKHSFEGTWKPENERHISGEDLGGQWKGNEKKDD